MYENITVNGVATIKNVLNIGSNYVTAMYPGDKNYTYISNVTQFDISKTNTSLTVEANPSSVVLGNITRITVRMVNVTAGKVLIEVGNYNYTVDINNGVAILDVALPVGEYTPKAYYLGDDEHKASNSTGNKFEVIKLNTTMGITVKDIVYGQSANITVTINNAATGYITIRINDTKSITLPVVEGKVNWIVSGLGADNYTVYANYSGDANYNINNTNKVNKSFEVSKADPDLHVVSFSCVVYQYGKIEISINGETAGEKLNITVGTYKYTDIVIPADGKLSFDIRNTLDEYKSYDVVVKYGGNANFTNDTFKYSYYTTIWNQCNWNEYYCW